MLSFIDNDFVAGALLLVYGGRGAGGEGELRPARSIAASVFRDAWQSTEFHGTRRDPMPLSVG